MFDLRADLLASTSCCLDAANDHYISHTKARDIKGAAGSHWIGALETLELHRPRAKNLLGVLGVWAWSITRNPLRPSSDLCRCLMFFSESIRFHPFVASCSVCLTFMKYLAGRWVLSKAKQLRGIVLYWMLVSRCHFKVGVSRNFHEFPTNG